jgi:hypothetical protein
MNNFLEFPVQGSLGRGPITLMGTSVAFYGGQL